LRTLLLQFALPGDCASHSGVAIDVPNDCPLNDDARYDDFKAIYKVGRKGQPMFAGCEFRGTWFQCYTCRKNFIEAETGFRRSNGGLTAPWAGEGKPEETKIRYWCEDCHEQLFARWRVGQAAAVKALEQKLAAAKSAKVRA
jgi:formate-dependent nitrite reductase cytochrome c552 subunit